MGVTSEPELCITELTPEDAFIILASDGVWEFIGTQEAVDIIGSSKSVEEGCRSVRPSPSSCLPAHGSIFIRKYHKPF